MANIIYTAITSLDGFIEDEQGKFDWAEPQEDVHRHVNDLESQNRVMLHGRRLYETMVSWESAESLKDLPDYMQDYGKIWRAAEKIVYSRTLMKVSSSKTTIKSEFLPNEVTVLKRDTAGNISIGGAELAKLAFSHGLVDEVHLYVFPVIVGNGKPALGRGLKTSLRLEETKRFNGGVVLLHYRVEPGNQS